MLCQICKKNQATIHMTQQKSGPPEGVRGGRKAFACPNCGTSYDDFKEIAKLGCSECYEFFKAQLLPVLRNLHVKTQHLGKFPASRGAHADDIKRTILLQEELDRAVREELSLIHI